MPSPSPHPPHLPAKPGTGNLIVHPDLPDLTRIYGYSSNTVWTEPQYKIWREHPDAPIEQSKEGDAHVPGKGAAIGFLISNNYAIVWGNPLCPISDFPAVTEKFLKWVNKHHLKPLFCCIDLEMEKVLAAEPFNWTVVTCVKEDVLDPSVAIDRSLLDKRVRTKINKAERAGVVMWEESAHLPDQKWQNQAEEGMQAWQSHRKGLQIHVTDLQPWRDVEHRRYFYGRAKLPDDPSGEERLVGMVVLTQAHDAWVVKWALEFPFAPKGTSEGMIMHVIEVLNAEGQHQLSFGASGGDLKAVSGIKGLSFQALSKTYNGIKNAFHLNTKSEFRAKFNASEALLYIAYPKDSLGMKGIDAILTALKVSDSPRQAHPRRIG